MNILLAFCVLSLSGADLPTNGTTSVVGTVVAEVAAEVEHFYARFSEPMPRLLLGERTVTPCDLCVDGTPNAALEGARYAKKRLPLDRWDDFRELLKSNLFDRLMELEEDELPPLEEIEYVFAVDLDPYDLGDSLHSEAAYEDYPDAGAILRVSGPAIEPDASRAVVYAELTMVHTLDRRFYLLTRSPEGDWIVEWVAPVLLWAE